MSVSGAASAAAREARAFRVAGGQIANKVGDLGGNAEEIAATIDWATRREADCAVFPELALTGYPLADLVLRGEFLAEAERVLGELAARTGPVPAVVGTVARVPPRRSWDTRERDVAIAAAVLCDGEIRGIYHKVLLPNYEVFEEARNFAAGDAPDALWRFGDVVAGISICEDMWSGDGPPEAQSAAGARILLVPNASPWHREKPGGRLELARSVALRNGVPVVYVNSHGGQDELVFDGGSIVVGADGELLHRAVQFEGERFYVDVPLPPPRRLERRPTTVHTRPPAPRDAASPISIAPERPPVEQTWQAIVTGTRDFAAKNGIAGAVVGLSGGIDSAVTAAVAAAALDPDRVLGVSMPALDDPAEEVDDTRRLAVSLGIAFEVIELDSGMAALAEELSPLVRLERVEGALKALESRLRAAILYAIADEYGYLTLATGNKSELSIGSAALYGDIAGGFAPLKDCRKALVYELAAYCDRVGGGIPTRIIDREPTAWASAHTSLPPPTTLDEVVELYVEQGKGLEEIVAAGYEEELARGILQLVDDAEFKRRQAPPGVKVSARAFGQDLRMPIASLWRPFQREQAELVGEDPAAALQAGDVAIARPDGVVRDAPSPADR